MPSEPEIQGPMGPYQILRRHACQRDLNFAHDKALVAIAAVQDLADACLRLIGRLDQTITVTVGTERLADALLLDPPPPLAWTGTAADQHVAAVGDWAQALLEEIERLAADGEAIRGAIGRADTTQHVTDQAKVMHGTDHCPV